MKFALVLLSISMAFMANGAPAPQTGMLGNAMQPEVHATGLVPMITGTNVPESEEEIEAPIYDEREIEKVKGLVKQTGENARNPEKAFPGFVAANPGFMSTVETLRISGLGETTVAAQPASTTPGPMFTLSNAVPTITSGKETTGTVTTAGAVTTAVTVANSATASTPTTAAKAL